MAITGEYFCERLGATFPNGYIKIAMAVHNNKTGIKFIFDAFVDEQAKKDGKNPLDNINMSIRLDDELFDTFFSEDILNKEGVTLEKQGYAFLKAAKKFNNFKDVI